MMLAALQEKFRCILFDVPRQMNTLTRHMLAQADHVVIVAEPQITALRDTLRIKDYLVDTLKRPVPKLVLNRVGISAANELAAKEFAKHYGHAVSAALPFMHEAVAAGAQGELWHVDSKLRPLMQAMRGLAQTLVGDATTDAASRAPRAGMLARLKGKA
jgi:pilus assembly protein CpaE